MNSIVSSADSDWGRPVPVANWSIFIVGKIRLCLFLNVVWRQMDDSLLYVHAVIVLVVC